MNEVVRVEAARICAEKTLKSFGMVNPPIDPFAIASQYGIPVNPRPFNGLDGCLLRIGKVGRICYRQSIAERGRVRFTVAHELGHWHLHPDVTDSWICTVNDISAYKGTAREIEANSFAANLLMPKQAIQERLRYCSPTLDLVRNLAQEFDVTATAAAVRMAEVSDEAVVVAFSDCNVIRWVTKSERARAYFVDLGGSVCESSFAWSCTESLDNPPEPARVEPTAWFSSDWHAHDLEVFEQSAHLGNYGIVLSVLTIEEWSRDSSSD